MKKRKDDFMNNTNNFVQRDGLPYYKITKAEELKPFFIQVASASDIWIFMSSKGGVTAGRKNADFNLFPYETEDRLHANYDTGSRTYIKAKGEIWQPFSQNGGDKFKITQNIYKSYYGNSVILEEINEDLQLAYAYTYESSEKFGFIKTAKLMNQTDIPIEVEVLDGLMNILPHGVDALLQATSSTLVDAYKAAELLGDRLAVYSLTTKINDTPNPIEILKANVAFHTLDNADVYLTPEAIQAFRKNTLDTLPTDCYGKKSAYFLHYKKALTDELSYRFVLDSGFDHSALMHLHKFVRQGNFQEITDDLAQGTKELKDIVASADGLQETADMTATAHHYLNTLYNVMRGGTFEKVYNFDSADFLKFLKIRNKNTLNQQCTIDKIKECTTIFQLKEICKNDPTFYRLALEYLPLSFSRRHGDPSRPWNRFNINVKDENGEKITSYEGNWRDIFQNWEALGLSYPAYYENMVAKFVNATTADGFNPYRLNQDGIDWEKPEPENPFAGFGYWGDHQIVYLHRLLKGLQNHFPKKLEEMLSLDIFSYANVPYLLNTYDEIVKDSKDTIQFDFARDEKIEKIVENMGTDGKLLLKDDGVYTVCLTEKLLVPLLSKLSNLLVGGGIWMNTQRPEWNDANNAIVGIGLSMVTVYHVKAYISFLQELFATQKGGFEVSSAVVEWFGETFQAYREYEHNYVGNEKALLDTLGQIFSHYRTEMYKNGLSKKSELSTVEITEYLACVSSAVDYTISKNADEVYATYNLLGDDFSVSPMTAMLEGQSAIIGSGSLSADSVCGLLDSMEKELYQADRKCHTLYPVKMTTKFAEKNILSGVSEEIDGITEKDCTGALHFHSALVTSQLLEERCKELKVNEDVKAKLLLEYDKLFAHKEFTGRSQVMYKFEGIGCVYWHQNAKLALAVLETVQATRQASKDATKVYEAYKKLMSGFIYRKTPVECNAIPVEPYSHSSFSGQSEQAGMTGQVKESVIMRRGELGIFVKNGEIHFDKWFIPESEFGENGEFSATLYALPTRFQKIKGLGIDEIVLHFTDGSTESFTANKISAEISQKIFYRSDELKELCFRFA
ncbi:MAG: hypothetical protein R3Y53_02535 [Bacillota bacterium]